MANETEPRALGAALAAPAFVTRGHGVAMHVANRHVERWAPEAGASRVRSMRSLGFVDRLVAPWIETAQRSASLRLLHQYASSGLAERAASAVSWVFPRPWYQDELDWMAASRRSGAQAGAERQAAPTLLTTRGTYVAPSSVAAPTMVLPSALYEHVAPSLSIASRPDAGLGFAGSAAMPRGEAYSPLIPLAAVQAADLMTRTVAPLARASAAGGALGAPRAPGAPAATLTPALRSVLASILARAAAPAAQPALRIASLAPELATPPAPRPDAPEERAAPTSFEAESSAAASAMQVAESYAAQRARIVDLQRIAQQTAQRELAARAEAARTAPAVPTASDAARAAAQVTASPELRAAAERAEADLRQRAAAHTEAQRQADAAAAAGRGSDAQRQGEAAAARAAEAQRQAETAGAALTDRAAAVRAAEATRQADVRQAEAARIEERIAQRIAERTTAQRLHEQARAEAAVHARATELPSTAPAGPMGALAATAAMRVPAEVTAAIAGLPPELVGILAPIVSQRPERAMQAIQELSETLRTVELLARSSASGAAFEATRGPRLMMPAGLGGLVNAVDRAHSITRHPAMVAGAAPAAPLPQLMAPSRQDMLRVSAPAREARVPALPWLTAERPQTIAPTTALGAAAGAAPAALTHVAWADRWLARFAGARPQSLETMTAAGAATPAARLQALANAAPGVVFVAPDFLRGDLTADEAVRGRAVESLPSIAAVAARPAAHAPAAPAVAADAVRRFDDNAETPDDVFAAIAAAASRGRATAARPAAPAAASAPAAPAVVDTPVDRPMLADLVAHAAPSAPGAGLSAQLASSPFAPALRHVLALPSAASFDVRSLFGAGLGATYLAGLISPTSHELSIGAQSAPTWAAWREAPMSLVGAALDGGQAGQGWIDRPDRIDRLVPGFDASYVSAEAPARADALSTMEPGMPAPAGAMPDVALPPAFAAAALTTLRTALLSWDVTAPAWAAAQPLAPFTAQPLAPSAAMAPGASVASSAAVREATYSVGTARRMVEAMSLPMLGESAPDQPAWSAPGMLAERAHTFSVAQERSASDLALDFVPPELVLAARVYGLGPVEAAQAARLAIVGPGQLTAMANTVDRTFIEAMAIGRDARLDTERHQRLAAERPDLVAARGPGRIGSAHAPADLGAQPAAAPGAPSADARPAITTAFPTADGGIAAALAPAFPAAPAGGAAFGVDRRAPRGAFLWPSATVAALGMNAAGPDSQMSMSVAALELLAAQVVAEIGTYTALSDAGNAALGLAGAEGAEAGAAPGAAADRFAPRTSAVTATMVAPASADGAAASIAASIAGSSAGSVVAPTGRDATAPGGREPGEAEVLGAASAFVPATRRARFEALYVALSQSPTGASWSPAARAARALALVGRGEDTAVSARERAATAWDVLPVVYAGEPGDAAAQAPAAGATPSSAEAARAAVAESMRQVAPSWLGGPRPAGRAGRAARGGARDMLAPGFADTADGAPAYVGPPGLSGLSARAGEALGSYVTPSAPPAAPREQPTEATSVGAVLRAPTAAQEYVQTGRSSGRYGGGEVEIPPWFEAAARKMLNERSSGDGISLAELTLVTAAPATHVAASTRSAPSASPPAPSTAAAANQSNAPQIDVEKLANEVYRNILVLMDVARARNGDPLL